MEKDCFLPDFCSAESNLMLILVLELVAIVLVLASIRVESNLFIHLALISLYIQWIGLSSAALLCLFRRFSFMDDTLRATISSLLVVVSVTVLMSWLAFEINDLMHLGMFGQRQWLPIMAQHVAISLVLYGLSLRYFYIKYEGQKIIRAESQARLQALQARIRPHFLFNSLNTIASLTHDAPARAEEAIENLADLFRASLQDDNIVSLQREIELTQDYIDLEMLRLEERLQVNWAIEQVDVLDIMMPALTLQPLVENAIYHGIEPLEEGGEVNISIRQDNELLIEISNPNSERREEERRQGNRMAVKNITERLKLAFLGQANIEHVAENDLYKVTIRIPVETKNSGS
ncbi:MAG: histidine kinase [Gammaproteobacteria bacterium]|nr:histidine kinase [Gammaproteobacteria bacterium]